MGLLVDGVWQQDGHAHQGRPFHPAAATRFRNWVTPDGSAGPSGEGGFAAESRPLSPLRLARLPLGAPHHDLPQAQRRSRTSSRCRSSRPTCCRTAGPSTRTRARPATPSTARASCRKSTCWPIRNTPAASACRCCGTRSSKTIVNNKLSEIIRMLNSAFDAFTNVHTDYYPQALARARSTASTTSSIRTSTTAFIAPALPPRRRPTRRRSAACSIRSTRSSRSCRSSAISSATRITEADWRLFRTLIRFDAVYYCALQVQLAAHLRISEPVELCARSLSGAGRRRDRQPRADQAALLWQPAPCEPDRHRSGRPAARLRRAA